MQMDWIQVITKEDNLAQKLASLKREDFNQINELSQVRSSCINNLEHTSSGCT